MQIAEMMDEYGLLIKLSVKRCQLGAMI